MEQDARSREEGRRLLESERALREEADSERNEAMQAKEKMLVDYSDLQQNYENVRIRLSVLSVCGQFSVKSTVSTHEKDATPPCFGVFLGVCKTTKN